jgi:hypothetical protein
MLGLRRHRINGKWRRLVLVAFLGMFGVLLVVDGALAALPDGRGYELVSPVAKNGVSPYAAIASPEGGTVDFQARGAFAGASSGSLNLYRAHRTAGGWQTASLTPTPTEPSGALEEQVPVWISSDLTQTIFTTPQSYAVGDADGGALSLYKQAGDALTLLSQGTEGSNERKETTFDGATPDGGHVVFSSGASLLASAAGLGLGEFPEPEYLYERNISGSQTYLLSIDSAGRPVGSAATTLAVEYAPGFSRLIVASAEGFAPGQFITVGEGPSAETVQIAHIPYIEGPNVALSVNGGGLSSPHPAGTPVTHLSEGAILGDGGHLTTGPPPAGEYLPANTESGSTTNAISSDDSKAFFESPNPAAGEPVRLYMRHGNTTVKIAGATKSGTTMSGGGEAIEQTTFDSARYEGAAADGSLVFFTSEGGLGIATNKGKELYEFNSTSSAIGGDPPMSVLPISVGLGGDRAPATTTTTVTGGGETALAVTSTAGFHVGETIAFAPFEISGMHAGGLTLVIASVASPTELRTTTPVFNTAFSGVPAGTEVYGVHQASMTAVSNDGLHVYFISDGVMAANSNSEGANAMRLKPNLYVFDTATGETTFIATVIESDVETAEGTPMGLVGEPDISRPAVPTEDGGVLVFASAGNLTGQNPGREFTEIYRYSVAGNALTCLSCTGPGIKPTGNATFGETAGGTYDPPGLSSPMSNDGSRVFFQTPDSLVPGDTNGGAGLSAKFGSPTSTDVYEWSVSGGVGLISSGRSSIPSVLEGTTPSGDDVLFTSTAQLVPSGADGGYENVFDARVGGGFPAGSSAGAPSCVGSSCRAVFGVAPALVVPGSVGPQGAGSPPVVKPKPKGLVCRKGFVRKRVKGKLRCVRKKPGKAGRAGKAAGRVVRGVGVVGVYGSR